MIFKVQISLATTDPRGQLVLAYNKDRTKQGQFPPTKELLKLMRGRAKAFFDCDVKADGKLGINFEVGDPGW